MNTIQRLDQNGPEQKECSKFFAKQVVSVVSGSIIGYAATYLFLSISPVAGAIFGAAGAGISSLIVAPILDELFGNSGVEKTAKFILKALAFIGAGIAAASLAGYDLSIKAGAAAFISINAFIPVVALATIASVAALVLAGYGIYRLCGCHKS